MSSSGLLTGAAMDAVARRMTVKMVLKNMMSGQGIIKVGKFMRRLQEESKSESFLLREQ